MIYDDRTCALGEGPLWHPERNALFWFDILGKHLLSVTGEGQGRSWEFDGYVSAAGRVGREQLLVASDRALLLFNPGSGRREELCPLEADNPVTRSNDGRADPWGGFWIGTMGIKAEAGAGAIYRYYHGELRQLYAPITISNAICFSPDRRFAYFTDTPTQKIMRQALSPKDGWPLGDATVWLDLSRTNWRPDGAVVDSDGNFWNAQWGGHRVACYSPEGAFLRAVEFPAAQTTCPAFGGAGLRDLYCTSAADGLKADAAQGKTYVVEDVAPGQAEHQVLL